MENRNKQHPGDSLLLRDQLLRECSSMAKHAFASGLKVPGEVIQTLEGFIVNAMDRGNGAVHMESDGEPGKEKRENGGEKNHLLMEIKALNTVHERLVKIVEPATPRTILLMEVEDRKKGRLKFLGVVPFIRRMMVAAIVCLVLFVTISLSPEINNKPETWNLFESSGWPLLLKELFLLCAAGLGASFTALFRANRYIVEGTFDPKYESSYWIRFSLGFIAGMILATLIPIEESMQADFGKPLLAMLGGFSADLVYRIISRLIETLESLFRGDPKTAARVQKERDKVRMTESDSQNRFQVASSIMKMQQDIEEGMKQEDVKKKMGKLINNMVRSDSGEELT